MPELKEMIKEIVQKIQTAPEQIETAPKKKTVQVNFDKGTAQPYSVYFSERGFRIGDTRLSFEELETAIGKGYTITLKDGFILTPVRMQQIMKYKERF